MTRPSWLGRAARNRHRHAIEQASRRWRGGRRDDSARTRRKILISTQVGWCRRNRESHGPDYGDPEVNPPRGRALAWRGDDLLVVVTSSGIMKSIVEAAARGDVAVSDL